MYLVLVESPTKIKTLEKFLGKEYKVLASGGHIRDLPKSKMGIDLENNFEPQYIIPVKSKKRIRELKETAKKADRVYLATDPDREGEAISYHLLYALDIKDYQRITFNEITESAIKEAAGNPRKINMDLVNAQQARRVLDRLVGYKLSPLLWKKITKGLSAGRVQSVALRIITDREKEIKSFVKEDYWSISAHFNSKNGEIIASLKKIEGKKIPSPGIKSEEDAVEVKNDIEGADFKILSIEKKEKKRNPSPPFTTSTLQQEAFKRLRFSSNFTMRVAQSLYEKGLITYHRTDSTNLSKDSKKIAERYIKENFGEKYYKNRVFASKKRTEEAHEAIRPSNPLITPKGKASLKKEEERLYDIIWRRFFASLMSEAIFYSTTVEIEGKNKKDYIFSASGSLLKFDGFSKIYPIKFEENRLPDIQKEEEITSKEIIVEKHSTKPPARFSEATLVKELEKNEIGRPSTYAPTISTLFKRNYIEKVEKRYLKPTEIGVIVSDLLSNHFPFIVDFKFTANMEEDLDKIAKGEREWKNVVEKFYKDFSIQVERKEKEIKKEDIMQEKTDEKCEKCGGEMAIKFGKYGKFIACKNFPDCKNAKPLEEEKHKEIICDKCNSKMKIKQSRFGKFYGCEKYPECKNIKSLEEDNTKIKCPECEKGDVVKRKSKRGNSFYGCSNYPECTFISNKKPE